MKNVIIVDEKAINNVVSNPKIRRAIYSAYAVLGVIIGSLQVVFQTYGMEAVWLDATISVYAYLALPVGALAFSNTAKEQDQEPAAMVDGDEETVTEIE